MSTKERDSKKIDDLAAVKLALEDHAALCNRKVDICTNYTVIGVSKHIIIPNVSIIEILNR